MKRFVIFTCLLVGCFWLMYQHAEAIQLAPIEVITVGTGDVPADEGSFYAYSSADGRYVSFESYVSSWALDQPPSGINWVDVFVRDRHTNTTQKITFSYEGSWTDEDSLEPTLSADGRYVAYNSYATNIIPNDTNRHIWLRDGMDMFVFDRETGVTVRATVTHDGREIGPDSNSFGFITPDGAHVMFASNGLDIMPDMTNGERRSALYLRNWQTGAIERITTGFDGRLPNASVIQPSSDDDLRYIVYQSDSSNLVPENAGDTDFNVYMYDRQTGQTHLISRAYDGNLANERSRQAMISRDGNFIVYRSFASNIVQGDTNEVSDIFVYDINTGLTERVSVASNGAEANGQSKDPSICGNGRYVSFTSDASNLVANDTNGTRDVFLHDRQTGETELVSVSDGGVQGNKIAHRSFLAPDCKTIFFATDADNVVPNDINETRDIYARAILPDVDFSRSTYEASTTVPAPNEVVTFTLTIHNDGVIDTPISVTSNLPKGSTYVADSATNGAVVSNDSLSWSGTIGAQQSVTIQYSMVMPDTALFTFLTARANITSADVTASVDAYVVLNATDFSYLPIVIKD